MTDETKLILDAIGELKTETGSLKKNVGDLKAETGSLKKDIGDLKTETCSLKKDLGDLKTETCSLKNEMGDLKTKTDDLKNEMWDFKTEMTSMKFTLENETNRHIKLIAEGHLDISRKLDNTLKVESEKEMLLIRVNSLENEVRKLKEQIEQIA
mgnify:CR=1 FL=1|jgi:chromosome segregation ATPase